MKNSFVKKLASVLLISLGALSASLPAQASTLINGWNYANDDQRYDGSGGVGGNALFSASSQYDFYGFGFKQVGQELFVGINTSYSSTGSAVVANVGYGDLFLDFGYDVGSTFKSAQGKSNLLGVRFAPNDSAKGNGVYTDVTGKSVASTNSGYSNLKAYNNKVKADNDNVGLANPNSQFGDLAWNAPYFADYTGSSSVAVPNVIASGTKYANGNVRSLSTADLAAAMFPTTVNIAATHKNIFGFAFTLPEEFRGMSFLATLGFECSNDTISGYVPSTRRSVPVPPAIAGLLVAGVIGGWRVKRKQQAKTA